jgi:hypothetical protein
VGRIARSPGHEALNSLERVLVADRAEAYRPRSIRRRDDSRLHITTADCARCVVGIALRNVAVIDGVEAVADAVIQRPQRDARCPHLWAGSSYWQKWQGSFRVVRGGRAQANTDPGAPAKAFAASSAEAGCQSFINTLRKRRVTAVEKWNLGARAAARRHQVAARRQPHVTGWKREPG